MKEHDIRPKELFDEYLRLAADDAKTYFADCERERIPCPACGCEGSPLFEKHLFEYDECSECLTFYVSPRPHRESFDRYYTEASSTRFWATHFYKQTEEARREKLWKPKAQQIQELLRTYCAQADWLCDIGGGYGVFAEEFSKISSTPVFVIEPSASLSAECARKGLTVIQKFLEDVDLTTLPDGVGCFVSFELFEHLHDPYAFLQRCYQLLPPSGILILTTLSGIGLDIRVLGKNSKAVFPPHHLNFFNPRSITQLLTKVGFDVCSTSTPGKLDVDILENNPESITDPFFKAFIAYADSTQKQGFQKYLVDNQLSSHMMIVARKI